jgi:hypothetical protein
MSALEELRRSTERQPWRAAEAASAPIKMSPLGQKRKSASNASCFRFTPKADI